MTVSLADVVEQLPGVTQVELEGEMVIFRPDTGGLHRLDAIAALVWQLIDGSSTLATICDDLAESFQVDREQVRGDVTALVDQLSEAGLVRAPLVEPVDQVAKAPTEYSIPPRPPAP